jgi:hypothetical protein
MRFALFLAPLALFACGPGKPGPAPNQTYFWRITSSSVEFNDNCSDEPAFRDMNRAIEVKPNSYVVYQGNEDGRKATLMKCPQLDPSTCTPADSGVVFDVAGAELTYAFELRTFTGSGMCNILDTQSWILTDMLSTMELQISDTLQLVDDPPICAQIEENAKTRAPNGKGFEGCTITFKVTGSNR